MAQTTRDLAPQAEWFISLHVLQLVLLGLIGLGGYLLTAAAWAGLAYVCGPVSSRLTSPPRVASPSPIRQSVRRVRT